MLRPTRQAGCLTALVFAASVASGFAQVVSPALRQADAAYRAGQSALAQHDLPSAQADFAQVVHLVPKMEQGHSALGAVLLSRGETRQAIHELETALSLNHSDSVAQMNLAMAYDVAGQPAKALPLFRSLDADARAQHHALAPDVQAGFARALASTGSPAEALTRMQAAVAAAPDNGELHDALGSLCAQQAKWPEAEQQFRQAIQHAPSLPSAHLHLGLALIAQHQDGLAELLSASQLAPENPTVALELGKAYAAAGKEPEAIAQFQRVLAHDPGSAQAQLQMALALQRTDHPAEALDLLRHVVLEQPDNAVALANLGMALTQAQQSREAVTVLQRSLARDPANAVAHEDLAAAFLQLNQLDDAVRELHAALKLAPDSPQVHYDLGLALKMQDQTAAAIPEFEAAERLDPSSPEAPFALGTLYMQAGRYADAAPELKSSLALRPGNGDGWATLGSVYNNLNDLPAAAAALQQAIRLMPDQPEPYLTLAAVLVKQNQPAEATLQRKKAAALMRSSMNAERAEVTAHAGDGMLKDGDLAAAADRYHEALGFDPKCRDAHLGLARVLTAQGKLLEAAAERKLADASGPTPQP